MNIVLPQFQYDGPICLALGFFDCIHSGHRALLEHTKACARKNACGAYAVTFQNNPYTVLGKNEKLIFTFSERIKLFETVGMDGVAAFDFDRAFMNTGKYEFLSSLTERFEIIGIVCGHDFKFGRNAEGDTELLNGFCKENNIMCDIIQPVELNNIRISSTLVRSRLRDGDIESAAGLLGHPYFIDGKVCHGRGVGKLFGFPTANVSCGKDKLLPRIGVYATKAYLDGKVYKSVTNVGHKPTFGESVLSVETMLIDFDGDIYGKDISVEFVRGLREIKKFDSPEKLREQIMRDAQWR